MQLLPKGYYAVQSDYDNAPKDRFTYRGETYAVTEGVNLFRSVAEASAAAVDLPEGVLPGLSYEKFDAPVLLCSAGNHNVERYTFNRSLVLLGEHAGVNPNVPNEDPLVCPSLNPIREENESSLIGSFDWGNLYFLGTDIENVIVDGFTLVKTRFRDLRNDGKKCSLTFRNLIEVGPNGSMLFLVFPAKADSELYRDILIQNVRCLGYDDYGYGGIFAQLCGQRNVLDGICYGDTKQVFGFTTIPRTHANSTPNADTCEYVIRNSYFRNLMGENAIATGARAIGDRAVTFSVENSTFVDASRPNEPVLNPHLANDRCTLTVSGCRFVDTRENTGAVISLFGPGRDVSITDCTYTGFAAETVELPEPPVTAPDYLENHAENWTTETADPHCVIGTDAQDFSALDARYAGMKAYYGDLHVHTNSGGTSDGKTPIEDWVRIMDEKALDFAAVVDHRQMRGFFLPAWDDERFIIGTEPGTHIVEGLNACRLGMNVIHYNMLFPHKYGLAMVLANFPEFEFRGDELTGSFQYPSFTKERFCELVKYVQSIGGIFVHPHPKTMLCSDDPLDFYYGEHTYIETLYGSPATHATFKNYELWTDLLAMGKRVYASSGSDTHAGISNGCVATFYTSERSGLAFFNRMHEADFAVGAIGMKMCIDGHPMGSEIAYREGMKLTLRLDDFFPRAWRDNIAYEFRIVTDRGIAYSSMFNGRHPQAVEIEVQKRAFYRAEIFNHTIGCWFSLGNPIWLD